MYIGHAAVVIVVVVVVVAADLPQTPEEDTQKR